MKAKETLELSQNFWGNYKLFLQEKLTRNDLKKCIMNLDDAIFYQKECNHRFNIENYFPRITDRNLDILVGDLFSELENLPVNEEKRTIFRETLLIFLGNYSTFVYGRVKRICRDIMSHFSLFVDINGNGGLDHSIQQMVSLISSAKMINEEEQAMKQVIFRLMCLYIYLAKSDVVGVKLGYELCRQLSFTFGPSTPKRVTLSYLKKKNLCVSEGKFSF